MVSPLFAGIAGGLVASIALLLASSSLTRDRPGPGDLLWARLTNREPQDTTAGGALMLVVYGTLAGILFAGVAEALIGVDEMPFTVFVVYGLVFGLVLWSLSLVALAVGDLRARLSEAMGRDRGAVMGWLLAVHLLYGLVLGLAVFAA